MSRIIVMPDGQKVRFGDEFDDSEIKALIEQKYPEFAAEQRAKAAAGPPSDYSQSHVGQSVYGINEGIGNALGFPVDAANALMRLTDFGLTSAGANVIPDLPEDAFGGSQSIKDALSAVGSIKPETDDPLKQGLRRIGQSVGATIVPGLGTFSKASTLAKELALAGSGGTAAAISQQVAPGNTTAEILAELAGSMTPMGVSSLLKKRATALEAPTVQTLEAQAGALYDKSEASGLVVAEPSASTFINSATAKAMKAGLDETLTPGSTAAIKRMQAFEGRPMSIEDATLVRRLLQVAAKGSTPELADDRRIATMMINDLDNFLIGLAGKGPQGQPNLAVMKGDPVQAADSLREANALYTRAKRGEMIETAIYLAGARAGQFSGSGFENALRTEFRAMQRAEIKGQIHLTPDEKAAITKVNEGGGLENAARWLGKFAPTGAVSLGVSAGVPFAVGNAVGGPLVGAAAAGTGMAAGLAGRAAATGMQKYNAEIAKALALRGGPAPKTPLFSDEQQEIIKALALAQAANQNERTIPQLIVGTKGAPQYDAGF